jgi:hypothetical protein
MALWVVVLCALWGGVLVIGISIFFLLRANVKQNRQRAQRRLANYEDWDEKIKVIDYGEETETTVLHQLTLCNNYLARGWFYHAFYTLDKGPVGPLNTTGGTWRPVIMQQFQDPPPA